MPNPQSIDDVLTWPISQLCADASPSDDGQEDWAVVVGISEYPGGLTRLNGPENDAMDFCCWLRCRAGVPVENITAITTASAIADMQPPLAAGVSMPFDKAAPTDDAVLRTIKTFVFKSHEKQNDGNGPRLGRRLYLYFSGHGFEPEGSEPACLTANARDPFMNHVLGTYNANFVAHKGIFDEVILIMDCCREVDVRFPASRSMPGILTPRPNARVFCAYATRKNSKAHEKEEAEGGRVRGVFTRHLLQALEGAADTDGDGFITPSELASYLYNVLKETQSPEIPLDGEIKDHLLFRVRKPAESGFATIRVDVPDDAQGKKLVLRDGFLKAIPGVETTTASAQWDARVPTSGLYFVTAGDDFARATTPVAVLVQGEVYHVRIL